MTKIANKLTDLIGNTPLLKLSAYMENIIPEQMFLENWSILILREV